MFQVEDRKTLVLTRAEAKLLVRCLGTLLEVPHRGTPVLNVTLYGEPASQLRFRVEPATEVIVNANASTGTTPGSTPEEATEAFGLFPG